MVALSGPVKWCIFLVDFDCGIGTGLEKQLYDKKRSVVSRTIYIVPSMYTRC